jgi:hypothetical protein
MVPRTFENITFWPVFHARLEFAAVVRQGLLADPPDVVAVELPGTWREPVLQAINRLPYLSLVLAEEAGEAHACLPVEPFDAIVEALRTARELGLPAELIDLDVQGYPRVPESVPDSYALWRLGYDAFLAAWYAHAARPRAPQDDARETLMAHALQQLARDGARIACVLGAQHLPGVLERLPSPQPRPLARTRPRGLKLYNGSPQFSREFLSEPAFLAAAYERWRGALMPGAPSATDAPDAAPPPPPDREAEAERLLRECAAAYTEANATEVSPRALHGVGRFARKYALVDGQVAPDLFHLVTAARGMVDDDYAHEVWERGSLYPWQDGSGLLPTLDLDERFAHAEGRRLTLHRRLRRRRPQLRAAEGRRLREQLSGRWKSQWSGRTICSHPPEDLRVEDYGRYLRHKTHALLSAERTRVEPFQVSLKDGVDVRETLRHWHEGRLYVQEQLPLRGRVGSVVVIFDADPAREEPERYPWCVTWLGEHSQESDMAFYATPSGEQLVGPGISRCEYGGFVMSYPPRRMADVWGDPFFRAARNKSERLLLAGLDYAVERRVLYVAERPPRPIFRGLAARMGRQLVYLPLGQLNPATLQRIRTFHVLDGHHVRAYAEQYIGRER